MEKQIIISERELAQDEYDGFIPSSYESFVPSKDDVMNNNHNPVPKALGIKAADLRPDSIGILRPAKAGVHNGISNYGIKTDLHPVQYSRNQSSHEFLYNPII